MLKIEFSWCVWHFVATSYGKNRVLVKASWMSYWRFSFLVVASNFDKWIQNSCPWIKFHTLPFSFGGYIQCISIEVFAMNQRTFVSAPWNFPFFLYFWSSFFCLLFRQNSMLAKKLAFNKLLVYYWSLLLLKI